MTFVETQTKMGSIFEALKVLEVHVQSAQIDLDKAIEEEGRCKAGLEQAKGRLKECKGKDLVKIEEFVDIEQSVRTVSSYLEQSKALRVTIQASLAALKKDRNRLQASYDSLGHSLDKIDNLLVLCIK
jgi:chromosome segregation ATPase